MKELRKIFMNGNGDPEDTQKIISYAFEKLAIIGGTYFLDGIMEVVTYSLRGVGYSITSMLIVLVGTCVFRIFWIYVVFPLYKQLWFLFMLYPLSWAITMTVAWIWLAVVINKDEKKLVARLAAEQSETAPTPAENA